MLIPLLTSAWAGSAGLSAGPLAFKGPARHDLRPMIGAWFRHPTTDRPTAPSLSAELRGGFRARDSLEHQVFLGRASVVFGPSTGNERAHTGLAAGPGLALRTGSAGEESFLVLSPSIRLLAHLDVHLGKTPLVVRYQLGSDIRGLAAWDFDVGLGLGAGW